MSIDYLPKAGSMTEKKLADFFAAAGTIATGRTGTNAFTLGTSGLSVYIPYAASEVVAVDGYAITCSSNSDLAVTLPANARSYVYLALDMAGGGTNTIGQRLIYKPTPEYIPHSLLIAVIDTDTDSIVSTQYLCDRRFPCAYSYHSSFNTGFPNPYYNGAAAWLGGTNMKGTTPVRILRMYAEKAGTTQLQFRLARSGVTTAYAKVYAASTGSTAQVTVSSTSGTGKDFNLPIYCTEGDILELEIYNSSSSGTTTISLIGWTWDIMVPIAPAFLLK